MTLSIVMTTPNNNSTSGNKSASGGAIEVMVVNLSINKQGLLTTFNLIVEFFYKFLKNY
jgi:hypothetical protein